MVLSSPVFLFLRFVLTLDYALPRILRNAGLLLRIDNLTGHTS